MLACVAGLLGACTAEPIEVATVGTGSLTDGLIAHWPLDEGTGFTANDTSGNGHNGVLQGPGLTWVMGKFGGAVHFSGTDLITVAGFPYATTSYTVAAWVDIAANEVGTPIANLVSTEVVGGGWALFATLGVGPGAASQTYAFEYAGSTNPSQMLISADCTCVMTGGWVHLAAVLDGGANTLTLYVNGAQSMVTPATMPIVPGSMTLNIGRSTRQEPGAAFPVTGAIDDVAIYNRPLEPQEIMQIATARVPDPN
jgi:hypothetical protein